MEEINLITQFSWQNEYSDNYIKDLQFFMPISQNNYLFKESNLLFASALQKISQERYQESLTPLKKSAVFHRNQDPDICFFTAYASLLSFLKERSKNHADEKQRIQEMCFGKTCQELLLSEIENSDQPLSGPEKKLLAKAHKSLEKAYKLNKFSLLYRKKMEDLPQKMKEYSISIEQFQRKVEKTSQNYSQFLQKCEQDISIDLKKKKHLNLLKICLSEWKEQIQFFEREENYYRIGKTFQRFFTTFFIDQVETIRITYEIHLKYSKYLFNIGDYEKLMQHGSLLCKEKCNSPYEPDFHCNLAIYKYFLFTFRGNKMNEQQKAAIVSHLSEGIKQKGYSQNVKFVASVFKVLLNDDKIFSDADLSIKGQSNTCFIKIKQILDSYMAAKEQFCSAIKNIQVVDSSQMNISKKKQLQEGLAKIEKPKKEEKIYEGIITTFINQIKQILKRYGGEKNQIRSQLMKKERLQVVTFGSEILRQQAGKISQYFDKFMLILNIKVDFLEILKKKIYFEEMFGTSEWYIQLKDAMLAQKEIQNEKNEKQEKEIIKLKLEKQFILFFTFLEEDTTITESPSSFITIFYEYLFVGRSSRRDKEREMKMLKKVAKFNLLAFLSLKDYQQNQKTTTEEEKEMLAKLEAAVVKFIKDSTKVVTLDESPE